MKKEDLAKLTEKKKETPIDEISKNKPEEKPKDPPKPDIVEQKPTGNIKIPEKKKRTNPNAGIAAKKRWAKLKKLEAEEAKQKPSKVKAVTLDPTEPQRKQMGTGAKVAFGIGFLAAFAVIAYTLFKVLDARKKNKELVENEGDYDEELIDEENDEENRTDEETS